MQRIHRLVLVNYHVVIYYVVQSLVVSRPLQLGSTDRPQYLDNLQFQAYFDVAVLEVPSLPFVNDKVQPLCLPFSASLDVDLYKDRSAKIAGWGTMKWNGPTQDQLMAADLTIFSAE